LWKFFYPADYQQMKATELPQPGQRRMWKSFDFKMSMQHDVTLDILFTKDKVEYEHRFYIVKLYCVVRVVNGHLYSDVLWNEPISKVLRYAPC